eukprot:6206947-Pleurochrysis_carterae.AAC.2
MLQPQDASDLHRLCSSCGEHSAFQLRRSPGPFRGHRGSCLADGKCGKDALHLVLALRTIQFSYVRFLAPSKTRCSMHGDSDVPVLSRGAASVLTALFWPLSDRTAPSHHGAPCHGHVGDLLSGAVPSTYRPTLASCSTTLCAPARALTPFNCAIM